MYRLLSALVVLCLPTIAIAEERFEIDSDRYLAGGTVTFDAEGADDLYMAGETLRVAAGVGGSAHLAGRRVRVEEGVGEALYAAGFDVEVIGAVGGDASVFGYQVDIDGPVAGDLRAAGSEVTLTGDVGGYALLSGELVALNGVIAGDAVIAARTISFGERGRVGGALTLYVPDPADVTVPASVAPGDRVTIRPIEDFDHADFPRIGTPMMSTGQIVGSFLLGVIVTGLFAALVIALIPERVRAWRSLAMERPGKALVTGFLVTSALVGSVIVLVFTLIGVLLVPFVFFLAWLVLFFGYALGAYILGAEVWRVTGREMPQEFLGKFGIATLGAFLTALAWVVPILGWLFVMGLTLIGVGALAAHALPRGLLLTAPRRGVSE